MQPRIDIGTLIEAQLGLHFVREYRFHPTRRWRADYAFPELKIAIEIDGGIWTYGRHNRAASMIADMEKGNNYAAQGWAVLHFTPEQVTKTETMELIEATVEIRKSQLCKKPSRNDK